MNSEQIRVISGLRSAGYAVVIFTPEEVSEENRKVLENRLIELGNEVLADLVPSPGSCKRCGTDFDGDYCKDSTCPHSDWPQSVSDDDLNNMTTEQVEAKYGVQKRHQEE